MKKIAKELSEVCASISEDLPGGPVEQDPWEGSQTRPVSPEDWNYDDLDDSCPECEARLDEPAGNPPVYHCTDCGWTGEHPNREENETIPGRI